ncbi:hypothetical protein APSETT444_001941 [Aspergillus pseudonomiae]
MLQHLLTAVGILSIATDAQTQPRRRGAYGDDCWPDIQTWNDFNATVGGRLIRSVPSAAVCHTERYNADKCTVAKESWLDSFWRTNQTGAYSATGIEFHDSFVPQDAPANATGIPAVTLQAGEQWFDVYEAAAKQGVLVVGGSARTVGAAGGYVLGGGHSPFAHYYGLAADNLLEVSIVSADGGHRVLNAYTDPEYFWAIRGGGGSAWGNLTIGLVQLNATNTSSMKRLIAESVKLLPAITEAGYTGYGAIENGFAAIMLKPNSTIADFNQTFAPFFNLSRLPGIQGGVTAYPSTWDGYVKTFLRDPNIGTNIQDTSRLLTTEVIQEKAEQLAEFIVDNKQGAGFNFIGMVNNGERDSTAVHDIWKHSHGLLSVSVDWADTATDSEKQKKRHQAVQLSKQLTEIVGAEGGTYVNEANP